MLISVSTSNGKKRCFYHMKTNLLCIVELSFPAVSFLLVIGDHCAGDWYEKTYTKGRSLLL